MTQIPEIQWVEGDQEAITHIKNRHELFSLNPGLEAEVVKVETEHGAYVLKIWNKDSKPNVGKQYHLLFELYNKGIRVSKPYGWGTDVNQNPVLLTSYDGVPISKLDKSKLKKIVHMLVQVHNYHVSRDITSIPKHDFVAYFFPRLEQHQDLKNSLVRLLDRIELRQDRFIHGDYNLGNILEHQDKLTVIDWTNGQLGDIRYDIAWSVFLMRVYAGERYGRMYASEFRASTPDFSSEDAEIFEAVACLRWILLSRMSDLSQESSILKRVNEIIRNNPWLDEGLTLNGK
ncbi:aminoglycoside phosphotransferase family protein [Paenibacillus sp. A14]|uniref:aminoglycoside phosphotransferase family protein n=1 Tax=Paenibacillus sp. A14 TaxID=3119820 RepID=UPI002FE241FF